MVRVNYVARVWLLSGLFMFVFWVVSGCVCLGLAFVWFVCDLGMINDNKDCLFLDVVAWVCLLSSLGVNGE